MDARTAETAVSQPIGCRIIPFPIRKRVGKIRRTVDVLSDRQGKGADHYWKQVVAGLRSQMAASGLPDDIIEGELRSFSDCVFSRLGRPQDCA